MIVQLKDQNGEGTLCVAITLGPNGIEIRPEGYGDIESDNGLGSPICLKYYDGCLRLAVWPSNNPEPIILDFEKTRESNRQV